MATSRLTYDQLREAGFAGWGAQTYERRLAGWVKTLAELQKSNLLPNPPARMLELGCGNGMASFLMALEGYETYGIEFSAEAVSWAKERFAKANLKGNIYCGDVRSMPVFDDGSFDIVIDGNCLHCIIGADRAKCLQEVRRILRPNGIFVVSSMCGSPKSNEAREQFDPDLRCLLSASGQPYRTLKPAEEIEREVALMGFRVMSRHISVNAWWDHLIMTCIREPEF